MIKIVINSFGQIGKLVTRRLFDEGLGQTLVLINDKVGQIDNQANCLSFDSVHESWNQPIKILK